MTQTRVIAGIFALLGLLFAPVLVQADKSESVFISSLRIGVHPDHTRIVLDLSGQPETQIFTLSAPDRVVLDLAGAQFTMTGAGPIPKAGLVDQYRFGLFRPGLSRLVLDLRKPVSIKQHFFLPASDGSGGKRMVIDLAPTSRQSFEQQAGFPKTALAPAAQQAKPVQPTPQPQPIAAPRPTNRRPVIMLDAGHGGVDPGAIGRSGTREKDVVFDVTKRLHKQLQASGKYEVHLTRDRDILIPLRERERQARAQTADLFISIHADSAENPKAPGAGVYTLSERASDKEAAALARRENRADIIAGVNLEHETHEVTNILIDLAQRETKNRSAAFAETLVPQLRVVTDNRSNPHRFAGFAVLKAPDIPSVLIELGFLTNRTEERRLRSTAWRDQVVAAIARAVDNYFKNHPVVAYGD